MRCALIDRAAWQFIKSAPGHRRVTRASITRVCKQTEINETKRRAPVSAHSVSLPHIVASKKRTGALRRIWRECHWRGKWQLIRELRVLWSLNGWLIHSGVLCLFCETVDLWNAGQWVTRRSLMIWFISLSNSVPYRRTQLWSPDRIVWTYLILL